MRSLAVLAVAAVTVVGCAHEPIHRPASERSSPSEVSYALPPGGDMRVALISWDVVEGKAFDVASFTALRVRMTVTNSSTEPWTVRPREQIAQIEHYGTLLPAATSEQTLVVPPGETRALDLFYPVPRAGFAQAPPQRVSLQWRVRLPGGVIGDRARLDQALAALPTPRPPL